MRWPHQSESRLRLQGGHRGRQAAPIRLQTGKAGALVGVFSGGRSQNDTNPPIPEEGPHRTQNCKTNPYGRGREKHEGAVTTLLCSLSLFNMIKSEIVSLSFFIFKYSLGDIRDLFNIKLKSGHAAAFATDCDLPSTHEMVRSIGMQVDFYSMHITAYLFVYLPFSMK